MTPEQRKMLDNEFIRRFGKTVKEMTHEEVIAAISDVSAELYAQTHEEKYKRTERFSESILAGNSEEQALKDAYSDEKIERKLS